MMDKKIQQFVYKYLPTHDFFDLTLLTGGANNRVYKLKTAEESYVIKEYFRHQLDDRPRLASEYEFSEFLWQHNIKTIPTPLAHSKLDHLALYSFIDGKSIDQNDVTEKRIDEAFHFITALNKHRFSDKAQVLGAASEAFFSINEQISRVAERVSRLSHIRVTDEVSFLAKEFVEKELFEQFKTEQNCALQKIKKYSLDLNLILPQEERILSPSDFGFHNMLLKDNFLYFMDFEYAGWDDPAKLVCDFYYQPRFSVRNQVSFSQYADSICGHLMSSLSLSETFFKRVDALHHLFRLKWACIVLNEFIGVSEERRNFAGMQTREEYRLNQLNKAKKIVAEVG